MPKDKLKNGFDPIWQSDFLDLRLNKLSRTAYIMRQMYRSYRNPQTNVCSLSDLKIHDITGWHRRAIKTARLQLIKLGEITPNGYHSFIVKSFHQFQDQESCAQKAQPIENQLRPKGSTSCAQKAHQLRPKGSTSCAQKAQPYNTDITDTDNTDRDFNFIDVNKSVKMCANCVNYDLDKRACYRDKNWPLSVNWQTIACEYFMSRHSKNEDKIL